MPYSGHLILDFGGGDIVDKVITVVVCIVILLVVTVMPGQKPDSKPESKVVVVAEKSAPEDSAPADADVTEDVTAEDDVDEDIKEAFPDYEEKLTDDTVLDYRPNLVDDIAALSDVNSENFTEMTFEVIRLAGLASANPGVWEDGNQPLGADASQYVPSDEELIAAELGDRLFMFSESRTIDDILQTSWRGSMIHPPTVVYSRFDFRHVDVMGSGRFFYASEPEVVELDYGKRMQEESEGP